MNLQVDFMLDSERRSGSTVSRKFIVRLAVFIVPVVLLGLFAFLFVAYQASKHDRDLVEQEQKRVDPEYKKVVSLEKEFKSVQELKGAIEGWGRSRLDAYRLMRGLQRAVPQTIQLTQWVLNEKVETVGTAFGRTTVVIMKGKVAGARPEADVQVMYQALKNEAPFRDIVAQVEVKRFAASEALDEQGGRVFDIECILRPRLLPQPAAATTIPK